MHKRKYHLRVNVILSVEAKIGGRTRKEAMEEFIRRVGSGNYDRQILKNLIDPSKRIIIED